ncbi:BMP family ABC transporter substrate-binding protein [Mycoplasma sp. 1018B]|uniref:BMP family ABC transporter substrate-binding protein n=1 Tax=Mycoplasma sp. 1018B TaxID=2967302 RepID=UPI00211C90E3|nr:BMP family ABC transporter substrate-binding protein [Mycoplasma sp. 1018B]UUM19268.1 BMP family ABC transporter substrate-binding protein [Mycoplasma sp. 1018B]
MKKRVKNLLAIGALSSSLTILPIVAISCENGVSKHPLAPRDKVAGIQTRSEFQITSEQLEKVPHIAVVTDGGVLEDKSFNQSSWEAIVDLAEQNKIPANKYNVYQTVGENFAEQYDAAVNNGAQILVLTGFHHGEKFGLWTQNERNKQRIKDNKMIIIAIDFGFDFNDKDYKHMSDLEGYIISIQYNTKEAGFIAGHAVANFLKDKKAEERTFSAFGGGAFPGVTDFIEGFMKGIYEFNNKNLDKKTTIKTNNNEVYLDSFFNPSDTEKQTLVRVNSIDLKPTVILPVAGLWNQFVSSQPSVPYLVGVDTDQAISDHSQSSKYFTSIIKKIGQSLYDVVGAIISEKASYLNGFELGVKNATVVNGVKEGWTGVTSTHLQGNETALANASLEEAQKIYNSLDEATHKWLVDNVVEKNGSVVSNAKDRINQLAALINKTVETSTNTQS